MKRILLTGKNGQIGWELERSLAPLGQVFAFDRTALDLADSDRIRAAIVEIRPDVVVNAAAYTSVDKAESEPELAMAINGTAPGVLAEEVRRFGALFIHYSTDYVFDGAKKGAYTEADQPNPLNAYGRSKLAGEQAIQAVGGRYLILRTSWIYGVHGHNFLRTIQQLALERDELRIVADQTGAPTWGRMIAEATALVLVRPEQHSGLFHLTASGQTSWYGFAKAILEAQGWRGRLGAIPTSSYPLPAKRPANSLLDNTRFSDVWDIRLPDWATSLRHCVADLR